MKGTRYVARKPDSDGVIHYPEKEHEIWQLLVERQLEVLPSRACQEYLDGLKQLGLPEDRIPQLDEVNQVLEPATGWKVERVPALISFDRFFELLSRRRFPVATFIRSMDELEYLQEPDVFHEIFGHCPLLTNQAFADFTQVYGELGYKASKEDRVFLARLYWMTVEFGLLATKNGLRIYGGGILSSPGESIFSLDSDQPERRPFKLLDVLRTPYRIDILQPVYYVIDDLEVLHSLDSASITENIARAKELGLFEPLYPRKAS
ncbi:phenylalanine 4-monooxygenase [Endozoicomonadaceae bacterium StTr2]